jgi:hypothetical protein
MRRVIVTIVFALVFGAVSQALSITIPLGFNLFFIPPVVLVFSLQFFKPFEIMFIALCCGAIADILGGFSVGFNMLLMLLFALVLGSFKVFSGRMHQRELIYCVVVISFVYRVVLLITQIVFFRDVANFYVMHLFLGSFVDGMVSVFVYYLLVKTLSLLKVFDQNDFFRNRIGLR